MNQTVLILFCVFPGTVFGIRSTYFALSFQSDPPFYLFSAVAEVDFDFDGFGISGPSSQQQSEFFRFASFVVFLCFHGFSIVTDVIVALTIRLVISNQQRVVFGMKLFCLQFLVCVKLVLFLEFVIGAVLPYVMHRILLLILLYPCG